METLAILRPHAETQHAHELAALAAADDRERPPSWRLSPWAVVTYLMGGALADGTVIVPKYVGRRRLMEIAVATLATDRALLLLGVPGTAKTWVSEHLAAAISGDSTLLVQGTAGTTEETLRYGWNYARLLAEGPSEAALVPSPVYRAMRAGSIARVEELTRMPSDVQDALVMILSEKSLPVPELNTEVAAVRGFNLIATANDRDRGINELSSALRRRFNTVVLPLPETVDEEMAIVNQRVGELGAALALPPVPAGADEIRRVVTIFRELRGGVTVDGATSLKVPSGTLSTAEAISVVTSGLSLAAHFGDGTLRADDVAAGIVGAVVRDPVHDAIAWREYLEAVVRDRDGWDDFYDACRARAEEVARVTVHLLGIRHHGPGSARSVVKAFDELRPDIVLVEAPAETTAALAWIGDEQLVPPVALLGHVVDQPHRAAFAPLASFSPEWQAVAWANERDVELRAIDLPLANTLAAGPDDDARDEITLDDGAPVDPLGALAAAAGEPDAERWWDDVVEHRGDGLVAFEAVADAMAAVRSGTVPSLGEERREAHMRRAIRAAVNDGYATVAVVCGAWHVPALDTTATPAATDNATLRGLRKVKVGVSWVPWTHRRLAAATGYGAGVRHPGWYDHVFRHPGPDGVTRFFVDAAQLLRGAGMAASPDHLIAASRMAETLSVLRGRPRPGLDEVLDSADAVMGGLPLVRRRLVVGEAIGEVPAGAPQVPLARDLLARQRRVRLKPKAEPAVVELDLRTPNGLARSHLLHQLVALGVGWGALEEGRGTSGTFRETWRVAWEPELSVRLVELAGHGTTVEQAATNRLVERAANADGLLELAAALDLSLLAHLADAVEPIVVQLSARAANDPDVGQLMAALGPLAHAQRYGDVRATDVSALRTVFDGLVVRVLAGVVVACASLDDAAARVMVERLSGVQAALALVDHPARHAGLAEVLAQLADGRAHGLVQGRATRLLHDGGDWDAVRVERRLGRALSAGTPPAIGAAFVEGFVAGSGTVLLHDADLRDLVDRWLSSLAPDAFTDVIPLLRRTFGAFEPAERRQLGRLLAGESREAPTGFGPEIDPARAEAALRTVRLAFGLPIGSSDAEDQP